MGSIAERGTVYKTAPVTGSPDFDPEYADVHAVYYGWGLKKGLVYQLLKEGHIKGVSLRRGDGKSGKTANQCRVIARIPEITGGETMGESRQLSSGLAILKQNFGGR